MKLFGAFFAVCTINGVQSANKTPYERRLTKTFDLLTDWSKSQLKGHPHFTQIREDKMSKTKFDFKLERVTQKIVDIYTARIEQIAKECPTLDTCEKYLDCSGEGDRMNTVRGRPDTELSDLFLQFSKDKWGRSKDRIFGGDCGFKEKQISTIDAKYIELIDSVATWRLQCRKFSSDACPLHCEQFTKPTGENICKNK